MIIEGSAIFMFSHLRLLTIHEKETYAEYQRQQGSSQHRRSSVLVHHGSGLLVVCDSQDQRIKAWLMSPATRWSQGGSTLDQGKWYSIFLDWTNAQP